MFTYKIKDNKENGIDNILWLGDEPIAVEKIDDHHVHSNLPSVSAATINNITMETYIIPEHTYKDMDNFLGNKFSVEPIETGPYGQQEYVRSQYFHFQANPNYYGGKVNIDNVVLRIIESTDT